MQNKDFQFAFQDKNFNFWQIDDAGMVTINSKPYFLDFSPDGWESVSVSNIRNKKYWGIDRSVTVPLTFLKDGAKILKHIFYKLGVEEDVYLVILNQELDYMPGVSYGYWYKMIYRGCVDLSTFLHAGVKVTCNTLEDGLPKYLKSNEKTPFEFPMNVPQAILVKMDGIRLHEKLNYQDVSDLDTSILYAGTEFLGPISYVSHDGNNTGVAYDSESLERITGLPFEEKVKKQNALLVNVDQPIIDATITGVLEFTCTAMVSSPAYAAKFRFLKSTQLVGDQNDYQIMSTPAMVVGQTYTQPFSVTVPLQRGEALLREGIFFGGVGSDATIQFTENSKFSITFISRQATTFIRAFRAQYLYELLISRVTEGAFIAAISAYFKRYQQKVFTCGNAVRGLDDAVMKITFYDFFKDWDSFDSVGIIEGGGIIDFDEKKNLIDLTNAIDLQGPANDTFKVSISKDFLFNVVEFGYPEIRNEVGVLNGKEEFNCKYSWSIGATKSPGKIDKVSPIKASCYEIELLRTSTLAKDTTDNKADNDLFSLYIEPTSNPAAGTVPEYYNLDRSLNGSATGLLEPQSVFNLPLSPKRNIIRNGQFMRSSLYLADNKILQYQSADKNNKVVCDGIIESANVPLSSMGEKFFLPLILEADFPAPDNLEVLLDLNPRSIFRFPLDGMTVYGMVLEVSVQPSKRDVQHYKFLSLPINDTTRLIDYE